MLPLRIKVLLQAAAAAVVAVRGPPLFLYGVTVRVSKILMKC
jgi:hypothetical protein